MQCLVRRCAGGSVIQVHTQRISQRQPVLAGRPFRDAVFQQRRCVSRPGGPSEKDHRFKKFSQKRHQEGAGSRITPDDRQQAAEDPWLRVNQQRKKTSESFGVRLTPSQAAEQPQGRSIFETTRSPTGQTHEHPYPIHPVYPRMADPLTEEQKRTEDRTRKIFWTKGMRHAAFIGTATLIVSGVLYEALINNPDKYAVPLAVYTMRRYKHALHIEYVVYLDVAIDGVPAGRIHIGLFHNDAPHFCANFYRLATGDNPDRKTLEKTLFYKCTGNMLYGGDLKGSGRDGLFAEGDSVTEDHHNNFSFPFGCYAAGPFTYQAADMNDSNFMIMLQEGRAATHGDFTCFGMVLGGHGVVEKLSQLPREPFPHFLNRVEITGCGESPLSHQHDAIERIQRRFHVARVRRFLATSTLHKEKYEIAQFDVERKKRMREKREVIEQELQETRSTLETLEPR